MPLEDLDPEQRKQLIERLGVLDLDEFAIIADTLEVPEGASMRLTGGQESSVSPRRLIAHDLDTIRRWIGTPEVVRDRPELADPVRRMRVDVLEAEGVKPAARSKVRAKAGRTPTSLLELTKVDPDALRQKVVQFAEATAEAKHELRPTTIELDTIRAAAHTYVRGDSKLVEAYKPAIEAYFQHFEILAWLFREVRVKRNSTLVFGPGANRLVAHSVVLEPGARVVSYGHLVVDCNQLKKETLLQHLPGHVLVNNVPLVLSRRPA